MKKYSLNKILLSAGQFILIGLLSLTVACKDEPARLTGDVLPDGEKINGHNFDEHLLATKNITRESVRTDDATYGIIGKFKDPKFGKTTAGFATDFSIGNKVAFNVDILDVTDPNDTIEHSNYYFYQFNNNNDTIADVWDVDSLVLNLQYQFNNWYGEMLDEQQINVYQLSGPLGSISQEFYNDHDMTGMYYPDAIASMTVHPNNEVPDTLKSENWTNIWAYPDSLWTYPQYLWDNVKVAASKDSSWLDSDFNGNTTTTKTWSFKLKDELASEFFEFTEDDLASTASFKELFNGIYVAIDEGATPDQIGWLTKVNLLSSSSISTNLTMHLSRAHKYLNSESEIRDTVSNYSYQFPINIENVRFNTYKHDFAETDIDSDIESPDRLYVQGMAGSYMQLQLPEEILTWTDSIKSPENIDEDYHMVSNIELYMEVDTVASNPERYPIPEQLTIKWLNDKGELVDPIYKIVINGNEVSTPLFGGNTDSQGNRIGIGERVGRLREDGGVDYLYRFIMRADYFNYIMRN